MCSPVPRDLPSLSSPLYHTPEMCSPVPRDLPSLSSTHQRCAPLFLETYPPSLPCIPRCAVITHTPEMCSPVPRDLPSLSSPAVGTFSGSTVNFFITSALSPDNKFLLSGSSCGNAFMWEVHNYGDWADFQLMVCWHSPPLVF